MIENKRYSFNWERGHPNFWDNHCDLADCYLTCADVVDRLNELYDENQELKKKNKQLIIDFMDFKMKLIEQFQIHYDYNQQHLYQFVFLMEQLPFLYQNHYHFS